MKNTKFTTEYRITLKFNTAGQAKFFSKMLTAAVDGFNRFTQSNIGQTYRLCSATIREIIKKK